MMDETTLVIAARATAWVQAEVTRKGTKRMLIAAYTAWKAENGFQRIERDTPEWAAMMRATTAEHQAVVAAKRDEANARRRLKAAVNKKIAEDAA